jgi:hypothetical protein
VGPKVQIRECLLSHLQGVRASSKQASMLSPAGVQGQLEARVAVHAGDGAKREGHLEVLSCEHVQVDIDDGTMRSILLMVFFVLFANCYGWAMGLAWFFTAAAQVEILSVDPEEYFFFLLSVVCE